MGAQVGARRRVSAMGCLLSHSCIQMSATSKPLAALHMGEARLSAGILETVAR